jgi:hypothetical protein
MNQYHRSHANIPPVHGRAPVSINRPYGFGPTMHTTLVAIDIVAFGDPRRSDTDRIYLHETMYEQATKAFTMTGLCWRDCYHEDRGDGALIIAPVHVHADLFLDPLAHHLNALLRRRNHEASDIRQLRIRMAVHHGEVHYDTHGVAGSQTLHLFRLLDAPAFKKAMHATDTALGLIVSDTLYTDANRRNGLIDATAYRKIRVNHKETRRARAWLWLPPGTQ